MWTLQDAKNRFSAVVEAALAGRPQEVSRRGKPAVVILSVKDYRRLLDGAVEHRGTFKDHLLSMPGQDDLPRIVVEPRDVQF